MSTEKKSFTGGCHCGFIKYSFVPAFEDASGKLLANRCNCTFCQKLHTTNYQLPDNGADFKLLSPASRADVPTYAPNTKTAQRYFCNRCGAHVWMDGYYEFEGQKVDLFVVNLATVDQPQEGIDLKNVQCSYFDGLANNFHGGLKSEPWPCGLI